jgi:hypothetical protein
MTTTAMHSRCILAYVTLLLQYHAGFFRTAWNFLQVHADLRDESLSEVARTVLRGRDNHSDQTEDGDDNSSTSSTTPISDKLKSGVTPSIVVLAKHLCADATDWALREVERCLVDPYPRPCPLPKQSENNLLTLLSFPNKPLDANRCGADVVVAALAPCCHPQIKWENYCNQAFLGALFISVASLSHLLRVSPGCDHFQALESALCV